MKLKTIIKKVKFLEEIKKDTSIKNKFLTMDIETRDINGYKTPYCISFFDGKIANSFYLSDFNNPEEMLEEAIKSIMSRKYDKYKVYLHNFSNFDGVFLLKTLSNLSEKVLRPIIRDDKIINFPFKFNIGSVKKSYILYFRDSLLLLPASLRSLASSFYIEDKGFFPYRFLDNSKISLSYKGKVPSKKYFDITKEEYYNYCKTFNKKLWELRKEAIKYCEKDCIILYNIIKNFQKKIFDLFQVDILKYPTLPSLSFSIFRSNFLEKKYEIPLIHGKMYEDLKKAYTGGSVDVYKPYGKEVYR